MNPSVSSGPDHLAAVAGLDRLLRDHNVDYWLFGGWAVDFHAGRVTREHGDIDVAIWSGDHALVGTLLRDSGWAHRPGATEDGSTCYERSGIRLEVAFLARDEHGVIFTPLENGRGEWPPGSFGDDVGQLGGFHARVVSRASLIADKSIARSDAAVAAKDRADVASLLRSGVVNYDSVAPTYDDRYAHNAYDGVRDTLARFAEGARDVIEVGCGTGHWLTELLALGVPTVLGIDRSAGMLDRAVHATAGAHLMQGSAESLPVRNESVDRVVCINALHHFPNPSGFLSECRRVLRPGGGVLTIGLDPHRGEDQWWVYDYFPSARTLDRARYPGTERIHAWAAEAGFGRIESGIAQHIPAAVPFDSAVARGLVERSATSQLMVIGDPEWETGRRRLETERPVLRADLALYASYAWR